MSRYEYDERFLDYAANTSAVSARKVIAILREIHPISSVLDVGCARGTWLREWRAAGVSDVHGVDGTYVNSASLLINRSDFTAVNLADGFDLNRKFDLVQSLEVAEHLPNSASGLFVESLVKHSRGLVLFSAAPPGQGGEHHINERPYDFWRDKFRPFGYRPIDIIRPKLAGDKNVSYWYRYNVIVYVSEALAKQLTDAVLAWGVPSGEAIADVSPPLYRMRKRIIQTLPKSAVNALSRIVARLH
jgi:hypothetical protein